MTLQNSTVTGLSYRSAGWFAIASGIVGIFSFGFLISILVHPSADYIHRLRFHDVGVILQFLFMIPVVFALQRISQKRFPGMSRTTLTMGIGTVCFVILFLLLIFPKILADTLYMVPQGIFGVWLIVVSWDLSGLLPRGLRWFGMVVGFGLALVGLYPLGLFFFVDTIIFRIPAASNEVLDKIPFTPANIILHKILWIGSLIGVPTFPLWTILIGRRLLGEKI